MDIDEDIVNSGIGSHTPWIGHCKFTLEGKGEVREKVERQQFTRGVETPTCLTLSPVYKLYLTSVKTTFRVLCPKSSFVHAAQCTQPSVQCKVYLTPMFDLTKLRRL